MEGDPEGGEASLPLVVVAGLQVAVVAEVHCCLEEVAAGNLLVAVDLLLIGFVEPIDCNTAGNTVAVVGMTCLAFLYQTVLAASSAW